MAHPIATIHYTECLYSTLDPNKRLQINCWQRDFWTKKEISDWFSRNPERPRSYIRNAPRKVTWTDWSKDPHDYTSAVDHEVEVRDFKEAKKIIETVAACQ